jgi:ABC-type bacteriocin/lantibiotic exporter with double-glycine peptidase domain
MFDVLPVTSPNPTDCGATCMKMLLAYYGEDVPLENLIKECNTRIIGCTGKDLMRVGRAHGLDMHAYKMDAEELVRQDRPSIIWWKYSHFVVLCGQDDEGRIVICNPDIGRYRMSFSTFASFFTENCFFNGEPHDLPESEGA